MKELMQNLSGGNQQKVLIARWLLTHPDILILDEPTRGIDVGAKYEIYTIMHDLIKEGKSIIMISSEMPELLGMADRVMVMCEGRGGGLRFGYASGYQVYVKKPAAGMARFWISESAIYLLVSSRETQMYNKRK